VIASLGWLVVAGAALASFRLKWSQLVKMALVWIAIFGGLYVLVEWYLTVRDATAASLLI
jgi:hypothetical protein